MSNPYEEHYFQLITPEEISQPTMDPEVQQTLMRRYAERVDLHTAGGWEILCESEFNTANSPANRLLVRNARVEGAELVVHSRQFDRRE